MHDNQPMDLTPDEVKKDFLDPAWAGKYPPILTLTEAAELVRLPRATLESWRSRRLLGTCSVKTGKHVRIHRDRFVLWFFNQGIHGRPIRRLRRDT